MVARHGAALLRVANQFSLCHDDALDAYQRALEIYLRRLATVDPATEGAWMRVVVKHEAMAIRRAPPGVGRPRGRRPRRASTAALREVDDEVAGGERVERSVEALKALKPDEARALLLKAEGLSYDEIGRQFGWTYTKVNRSIAEGRKRFLKVYDGIESGEACERYEPVLDALAGGTRDERADGLDPPAPAPLRGLPGDGARRCASRARGGSRCWRRSRGSPRALALRRCVQYATRAAAGASGRPPALVGLCLGGGGGRGVHDDGLAPGARR